MRKLAVLILCFVSACGPLIPDDFPPAPPMTVIVEFPNYTATPAFIPVSQPITSSDMPDAETFVLLLKTNMVAGNSEGIAESVLYPIDVQVNGQTMTIDSAAAFVQNYDQIFNETILNTLAEVNEEDLVSGADGIRVGNGELWFNLFCMDAACSEKSFLITQINGRYP